MTSVVLTTPSTERRRSDRRRACLGGTLRVAAFVPEVECRLRDLSLTGARIVLAEDAPLPRLVDLTVPCRNHTRRARLVWRAGTHAGLVFLDDAAATVANEPEPERAGTPAMRAGRLH